MSEAKRDEEDDGPDAVDAKLANMRPVPEPGEMVALLMELAERRPDCGCPCCVMLRAILEARQR